MYFIFWQQNTPEQNLDKQICNAHLTLDFTEKLGKALCLHLLSSEYKGRGWGKRRGCLNTKSQRNKLMLETGGTSCWLVSASRYVYLLPAKLEADGQLCLSFRYCFFLTIPYTGYMHGQAPCVYNFIWVVRSCGRGLNHKNYFAAGQDIPLNVSAFCFL